MGAHAVWLCKNQTGGNASDVEERRDVACYLTDRLVRRNDSALVDALDGKEHDVRGEDDSSLKKSQGAEQINNTHKM